MKAKTHSRIIAATMALVMLLTVFPVTTFAQEKEAADNPEQIATELRIDNAKIISEDTSKRSEREKHFKLSDGTYLAVKYGHPVHIQNEDGEWEDIDLSFAAEESDGTVVYVNKTDALTAAISDGTHMHLTAFDDELPVSLRLQGFDMVPEEAEKTEDETVGEGDSEADKEAVYKENISIIEETVKSPVLRFADNLQQTALTYDKTYSGIRQSIVIDHELDSAEFSYALETGDFTAALNDSGSVEIKDGGKVKYIIAVPYMYDSENRNFAALQYTLEESENGGYILAIKTDGEILNSDDISYPVTISASVTVPSNEADRSDSMVAVSSYAPDKVCSRGNITIGKTSESDVCRAFFDAEDLPVLTNNDVMLTAQLHTYQYYHKPEDNAFEFEAHAVTEEWDAESITWNTQPTYSADKKEYKEHEGSGIFAPVEWDITKEAFDSYEGEPSYGIVLKSSDETKDSAAYLPNAYAGELCPYILVSYISISQNDSEDERKPSDSSDGIDSEAPDIVNADVSEIAVDAVIPNDGDASYPATSNAFDEITSDLTIEYCVNNRDEWEPLTPTTTVDHLDGVRIRTNSSKYYLRYRSKNSGKGWLDPVYSTKSGVYDYAGLPGHSMTNLSIEVYNANGTRIYDDYVVMYRAKVAGQWLEWVSNGWPDIMQAIKDEKGLSGNLDEQHTDAGWEALGNIQGLEIRMFKRSGSSSGGSSGTEGTGDFQLATDITMEYYKNKTWYTLNPNISVDSMDGVRLQTNGKPYYLWYRSKNPNNPETGTIGWLGFVSSDKSETNDYAGWPGFPMSNLEIQVRMQDGTRIFDNYVVMYRARVPDYPENDGWLPWVSNGWPEIMRGIMPDAALDTKATDAGDGRYGSIQALEIRVYERKGLDPTPSKNAKLIKDVPYINQLHEGLPNGCESASAVMALQKAAGTDKISLSSFINNYLDWTPNIPSPSRNSGPNPNEVYMGNPFPNYNDDSWGCFSLVIMNAIGKLEKVLNVKATNVSGTSLNSLCTNYIDKDIPVIMWATVGMTSTYKKYTWVTSSGEPILYNSKLHCLLLVGYDENNYFFNDPMAKKMQGYSKASVEAAYEALGHQAIVITKGTEPGGQAVAPPKDETVKAPVEIPKAPSLPAEKVQDPIDLSTGAHVIDHTLMTVSGAQTLSFGISYRSNVLTESAVGKGWSHNFEKKIVENGSTLYVYDSPAYYAVYKKTASNENVFTSGTVTKENYTVAKTSNGYTVNCNNQFTEYYDGNGRLTKITTKSGFNTLLSYTENTITITDEVSGRYILLTKDSDGRITSVTDNTGRTSTLGYIDGNLVSITDENGGMLSYQYNEKGQIERGRDQNGTIYFTDTYDSADRVISQSDAVIGSNTTVIKYDDATDPDYRLVSVTDRTMETTVYKYNSKKQLVSKTDPNGVETKYEYDAAGNLTKKTDGLGNSAVNVYDGKNNLVSSSDRLGNKTEYTYDAKNNLTKVKYPDGGAVINTYDANDRLISSTDLRGVTTTYEYDAQNLLVKTTCGDRVTEFEYTNGQATKITDALGRTVTKVYNDAGFMISSTDAQSNTTSYTYDNKGNVLTVTDPAGNVSSKEYDKGGNLIKSTDAKGNVTTYTYNGNLKMTSMTLPNGAVIRYAYDGEDRLVKTIYPDNTETVNVYDAGGRLISTIDRDGNTVSYEYDAANNVVKTTNAAGGVILKEYDAAGNMTKSTEPLTIYDPYYDYNYPEDYSEEDMEWAASNVTVMTSYAYDSNNRLTKSVNSQGGKTVYAYNTAGDLISVTDALGNKTTNVYDSLGNLLSVTDPRGNTTSYTYDKVGNLLTTKNALNQITTNTYDSMNRLISTKDPGGHTVSYEYDVLGRMTSCTDAKGNTVTKEYDALGNIVKITNASGHVDYEAVYNSMGKATEVTDAAGSKTTNTYDWEGNLTKETNALNQSASYTYNGAGQMISAVDKAGGISYATYDGMGNLTSITGPGGNVKEYIYDPTGRMLQKGSISADCKDSYYYNAAGLLDTVMMADLYYDTHYTYDATGRVTEFSDSAGTKKYTYDANGNVTAASDATGTVKREYDALNRVTKYTDIYGRVISYEYDCCGNLSKMTYYTGEVGVYTYDANHNMLSSGVEGEACTTTYEYNKQNQVTKINNIDGGTVTKNYDSAGRLQLLNDRNKNGKLLFVNIFTYDALGRITSELDPIDMIEYQMTYDSLGRLTKRMEYNIRTCEYITEETFTYDAAGNILTAALPDGTENTYQYDQDNLINKMNDNKINVMVGNIGTCMINGKKTDITYDARNRLKKIGGDLNEYWYDPDNNRINMYYYHTNMQYLYDCSGGRNRLIWTSDHNENVTSYFYGAEGLLWSRCNGEYQIYHYDYRGSVVAVTDKDGNVTDTLKYDAYGSTIERTGDSKLIFGYNGQYGVLTDPNGLLYMRTRFYNPDLKRFMNADILDGSIEDSTSLNLYTFVNGNPISYIDPFGMDRSDGQGISLNTMGPADFLDPMWLLEILQNTPSVSTKYVDLVIKGLTNMANDIELYYGRNKQEESDPYINAINKAIYSIQNSEAIQSFDSDIKMKIEIYSEYNISGFNLLGDFAGFFPVLGEIYDFTDFLSDESKDFSKLGSAIVSIFTEGDIAALTPYAKELRSFGNAFALVNIYNIYNDIKNWNSPENIKTGMDIFLQQGQGLTYWYSVIVNDDMSFKTFSSGFTGTVLGQNDKEFSIICR